ncbi:MAG: ABC transporter permease, partial [Chloroflexota bacterium]|nr:ABC transporter permease [Chloroflexota bacterium]
MAVDTRPHVASKPLAPAVAQAPSPPAAPVRSARRRLTGLAAGLTGFILPLILLIAWHLASVSGLVKPYLLPPPTAVAATLWELTLNGTLAKHVQASVTRWAIGFVLGGGLGLLLGSWVGLSRRAERLLDTSVQMLRTVPFLAMAPLLIIWLGLDEAPKITLVGLAAFFPLYI